MRTKKLFLGIFALLLICALPALAEDKLNLGTTTQGSTFNANAGDIVITKAFIFNAFGTVDTTAVITSKQCEGMEVTITPNKLIVPPNEPLEKKPSNIPEGVKYLPSKLGYLRSEIVDIEIELDKDLEDGIYLAKVLITASYDTGVGTVALQQQREFEYRITVGDGGEECEIIEPVLDEPEVVEKPKVETEEKPKTVTRVPPLRPQPRQSGVIVQVKDDRLQSNIVVLVIILLLILIVLAIYYMWKKIKGIN